jgi:hypothetical protein
MTVNPSDLTNPLILRIAGIDFGQDENLSGIKDRIKQEAMKDACVIADFFNNIVEALFTNLNRVGSSASFQTWLSSGLKGHRFASILIDEAYNCFGNEWRAATTFLAKTVSHLNVKCRRVFMSAMLKDIRNHSSLSFPLLLNYIYTLVRPFRILKIYTTLILLNSLCSPTIYFLLHDTARFERSLRTLAIK